MSQVNSLSSVQPAVDSEAVALAACYRLLLQKAAERRARLTAESDSPPTQEQTDNASANPTTASA